MILENDVLGKISYSEEEVIEFIKPIYGFEEYRKFVLVSLPEKELPFYYLQSIEDPTLNFIVTSPFLFVENYEFDLPDEIVDNLEIHDESDLFVYSLVVIKEPLEETTLNLKAPIILNIKEKKARQYILKEDYTYRYKLFKNKKVGR